MVFYYCNDTQDELHLFLFLFFFFLFLVHLLLCFISFGWTTQQQHTVAAARDGRRDAPDARTGFKGRVKV